MTKLHLDLDQFWEEEYFYTDLDIGGAGHGITIESENKEKFISAFCAEIASRLERMLQVECDECHGTGEVGGDACSNCDGSGWK